MTALKKATSAFAPRTDTMMHFIHDSLHGTGGFVDFVRHEMPTPSCDGGHFQDQRWMCDAVEWVLRAAVKHQTIMAALNAEAERLRK